METGRARDPPAADFWTPRSGSRAFTDMQIPLARVVIVARYRARELNIERISREATVTEVRRHRRKWIYNSIGDDDDDDVARDEISHRGVSKFQAAR